MAKNSSLKTLLKAAVKIEVQRCSIKGVRPATLLKKRLWHRCFPVNFAKFLRTSFIIDHLWWLLLSLYINCWITSRQENFNEDSIACSVKHQLWNLRVKSLSCEGERFYLRCSSANFKIKFVQYDLILMFSMCEKILLDSHFV